MFYNFSYLKLFDIEEKDVYLWVPAVTESQPYKVTDKPMLHKQGWRNPPSLMTLLYALSSQYSVVRGVIDPTRDTYDEQGELQQTAQGWYHKDDIAFVKQYPVIFPLLTKTERPPNGYSEAFGEMALIATKDKTQQHSFFLNQLPEEAQTLHTHMNEGMNSLACSLDRDKSVILEEVHRMVQELAKAYYTLFSDEETKLAETSPQTLPPVTSNDKSRMPSSNHFRALVQGCGPGYVSLSLWNSETSDEQQLITSNGSMLRVRGQEDYERKALHTYITTMMGTEGLKALLTVIDAYYIQTGAQAQHINARISLRQLMIRMGYSEVQANDLNERRKMAHTILYFARTWVTSPEKKYVPQARGRGKKKLSQPEYSPLLVIEKMRSSADGGLDVPDEIKYHLGEDYYNSLFGEHPQYFTLPTAQVLAYHAVRQQQELCLAFYLSNMVIINKSFSVHFRELLLKTALMLEDDIDHNTNRTRHALRVVYAIEQLEKDGFIYRAAHDDLDIAMAIELFTRVCSKDDLSPTTYKRITTNYTYLQSLSPQDARTKRRVALQRLLKKDMVSPAIVFSAGPLLKEKAEKIEELRQRAIDRSENAQIARVVKIASAQLRKDKKQSGNKNENH